MDGPTLSLFSDTLLKFSELTKRVSYHVPASFAPTLDRYIELSTNYKQKAKETSYTFNALSFFNINEPKHSFLLAYLLNPYENHGQGMLFLKKFLNLLGIDIKENESSDWIITAEKERLDISIKRKKPTPIVVVIENKSHNAVDQPNQLYRYWYYQIHEFQNNYDSKKDGKYHVIYLAANKWKKPSKNSLSKPESITSDIEKVPEDVLLEWQFSAQIKDWLESCISSLHYNNHRMREYLLQYIEIIEQLK